MVKTKEEKKKILEELKEKISKQKVTIFVDFTGLKMKDIFDLRKKLKMVDSQLKVTKKTLAQIAFNKSGLKTEIKKLKGEIAFVFGLKDEISPAKIIFQFSQINPNLKILGGFLENKFVEAEKIVELAKLPTREELLGKLVGSISAPVSNLINVLQGNLRNLVSILSQLKVNQ
ncbi:MAG: 50S ribosomal protein L10 [Candidatus Nealsonbacteria bacterium CG_4_10_14_0_2_um_filter_40_15]|uniref:Large ribosomal subunit protein uL10 n=1 Tax=Candidatus Nealsonbacteria bacterium CG_4_10_14_0_2_um_filter_40_15 TaxID=1974682 RepID=A0A2M7UTX5_9BACT|nr:MAG: 50S ribosomal protein L10 [Candidatus Nealsonbacteria bacterium CG_4_10_14_0_2_um_filter_40_15]